MPANIDETLAFSAGGTKKNPKPGTWGSKTRRRMSWGAEVAGFKQTITEQLVGSRTHG